jgi:Heparinase II/III N-terminus/Heparinase II/III-like protein
LQITTQKASQEIDLAVAPILKDTFTFQLATKTVSRRPNNLLDWSDAGLEGDREWNLFLNRHYHLLDLFVAYQKTGNPLYAEIIGHHVIDWIISNHSLTNPFSQKQWRGLEVAHRITHWVPCFYGLQQVQEFSGAVRILMLSSILDHAYYLRHLHSWGANWLSREMNALATVAICWPEFRNSQQWFNYGSDRLFREINEQVYPDGVHKELISHYHLVTLENFQNFANLLKKSGLDEPESFRVGLEQMWNYLAYSMSPDGHSVLNNDSDRDNNRPLVHQAAVAYQRPDWTHITSNGKTGHPPPGEPSAIFPWAGQLISRSDWKADAHWSFFDLGSAGISYHIHNDKLHLSLAAYGRDLLVDSGRYRYVRDRFWHYFRGSASHNVILIDGKGQKTGLRELNRPLSNCDYAITSEFDLAVGTFDNGFINLKGKASHSRAVLYLRDKYWVVIDRIVTDRPRQIEALWHFHPDCTVVIDGQSVGSVDPGVGNLKIVPVSSLLWDVQIIRGQENPVQGWWSLEYNQKVPNSTVEYSTEIEASATFAWVLSPTQGIVPNMNVNLLPSPEGSVLLRVEISDHPAETIAVNMVGKYPIELGENLKLEGKCAVLRFDQEPLVALGRITDSDKNNIVSKF